MKTAVAFLALTASANAFAPASTSARSATAVNAAELDGMLGVGPETAGKVVSDDSFSYMLLNVQVSHTLQSLFV